MICINLQRLVDPLESLTGSLIPKDYVCTNNRSFITGELVPSKKGNLYLDAQPSGRKGHLLLQ